VLLEPTAVAAEAIEKTRRCDDDGEHTGAASMATDPTILPRASMGTTEKREAAILVGVE